MVFQRKCTGSCWRVLWGPDGAFKWTTTRVLGAPSVKICESDITCGSVSDGTRLVCGYATRRDWCKTLVRTWSKTEPTLGRSLQRRTRKAVAAVTAGYTAQQRQRQRFHEGRTDGAAIVDGPIAMRDPDTMVLCRGRTGTTMDLSPHGRDGPRPGPERSDAVPISKCRPCNANTRTMMFGSRTLS